MKTGEQLWDELCDYIIDALADCIDNGTPFRASFGSGQQSVTVDIYQSKATMKKFDELALGMVKEKTGISLLDPEKESK